MDTTISVCLCDIFELAGIQAERGQRPSQQGFNRLSESSAVFETSPEYSLVSPLQMENLLVPHTLKGEPCAKKAL